MKFVFLIPLFPLLGFLFNFLIGVRALRRARDEGHGHGHHAHGVHVPPPGYIGLVAAGMVGLSFVVALIAVVLAHQPPEPLSPFATYHPEPNVLVETLWTWIP